MTAVSTSWRPIDASWPGNTQSRRSAKLTAKAATSATAGASVSERPTSSWSPAVAPITKRKLKAEAAT